MKNMTIISLVVTIVLALVVTKFVFAQDAAVESVADVQAEQAAKPVVLDEEATAPTPADQEAVSAYDDLLNELDEDGN